MLVTGQTLSRAADRATTGPAPQRARPLVVELVGPAGAGKTALLRTVGRDPRVRAGVRIDRVRMLPALVLSAVRLVPLALRLRVRGWDHAWAGLVHLMRLRTLPQTIAREAAQVDREVILLDEGPVFSLGRLSVFQGADRGEGSLARAWHAELDRWTGLLDGVIWIDAPDAVLAERIRSRPKYHKIKGGTDTEMAAFLGRYREAYRKIRDQLTTSGRIKMVQLDTSGLAVEAAAQRLLAELERLGMRHSA